MEAALLEIERLEESEILSELRRIEDRQLLLRGLLKARRQLSKHHRERAEGDRILARDDRRKPGTK